MTIAGFWRDFQPNNQQLAIGNFKGVANQVHYLFPDGGGPGSSFLTFADLKPHLRSRDVILLGGVLREQAITPEGVYDVLVQGAGNTPRQATDGGVPTGGGATWMAPASGAVATTPLLQVIRQGWTFNNILFNPHTSSAAVRLTTSGGLNEAGQASFLGCTVLGGGTGQIGIEDNGGSGFVSIEDCLFQLLTGTAILGLSTSNAIPLSWRIKKNIFTGNTNDIKMSLSNALIKDNVFNTAGSGGTNKVISTIAVSGQGNNNMVLLNFFKNIVTEIKNNNGYDGGSTDTWANYAEGTAALIVESPPGAS